ncbi:MAG: orotidine-5'-phosphate decarboxylase [Myxococcales bacterium]|nr:orotidine-5'-phosphate decarboxylase [Myxococcales bacterium]
MIAAAERLIVALDYPSVEEALVLCDTLAGLVTRFKIGLELFTAGGPLAVAAVRARGMRVFLDLKIHDIPETARRAARAAAATGAELITVHTAGGPAMLAAAVEGARHGGGAGVLAVTVLTSLDALELARIGTVGTGAGAVHDLVLKRAEVAQAAGCVGVIASPREVKAIRALCGPGFLIVTPGVRSHDGGGENDDQKRTGSAGQAISDGADAVVVGRQVRDAAQPRSEALILLDQIALAALGSGP